MSLTLHEIESQPTTWRTAIDRAPDLAAALPPDGTRALYLGCGTSAFVARSIAGLRERAGRGHTDWAFGSELPVGRSYDHVVAISRSGTTTEVLEALRSPLCAGATRTVITGVIDKLPEDVADQVVDLGFADERSVVQTRFPTTFLVLIRRLLGEDLGGLLGELEQTLAQPLPVDVADYSHYVYLARDWSLGLADEAALKMREAAQAWAEAYPALDYRHGPIAAADSRSLVVPLCDLEAALINDITAVGASVAQLASDPLVRLVQCQRLAVALAEHRGLDPDHPRHLTRSVVLTDATH